MFRMPVALWSVGYKVIMISAKRARLGRFNYLMCRNKNGDTVNKLAPTMEISRFSSAIYYTPNHA